LKLLKEKWLTETSSPNLLHYASNFKARLNNACKLAQGNLKSSQTKMKRWYDKVSKNRVFKLDDKVLIFLPIPGHLLRARYYGPYEIESKLSDVNYVVKTLGRRKEKRVCHINMLKEYFDRCDQTSVKSSLANVERLENCKEDKIGVESSEKDFNQSVRILTNLDDELAHLDPHQRERIQQLVANYPFILMAVPKKTTTACGDDVILGDAVPIKHCQIFENTRLFFRT
jgi:hypothetical protein